MAFCSSCGKEIPADSKFCPACGANTQTGAPAAAPQPLRQPMQNSMMQMDVPNHLGKAIFITLCCCMPLGVISIIFAAQVDSKLSAGDFDGAVEASNKANTIANWGIGLGIVSNALVFGLQIFAAIASEAY